jgi:tRNA pseudouridine55 synthase
MDGILNINKPSGLTSFDIVAQVKRLTGEKKVGHGGTLDPLASGILPVFLGQATRLAEYMLEHRKTYRAEIELGISTDTYDAEGRIVSRGDASNIATQQIEAALTRFRGQILQTPPAYSALKQKGQPIYKAARQGIDVKLESRPVTIYHLELLVYQSPLLILEIECGKGTYIRSIAHDLGREIGSGAYLKSLVRTAYGPFNLKNAAALELLQLAVADDIWESLLFTPDFILSGWPIATLTAEQVTWLIQGKQIALNAAGQRLVAYGSKNELVALLKIDRVTGLWQPQKVFRAV